MEAKPIGFALGLTFLELGTGNNPFSREDNATRLNTWDSNYFKQELSKINELQNPAKGSYWEFMNALLEGKELKHVLGFLKGKKMTEAELKEVLPKLKTLKPPPRMAISNDGYYIPKEKNPHYAVYGQTKSGHSLSPQ